MKVSEAIKNIKNYIVTKNGKILAIDSVEDELLNLEVDYVEIIEGVVEDLTCVRL